MGFAGKNSFINQQDKPETWIPENYLLEMRDRLDKLRQLQGELNEQSFERPALNN